MEGGLRDPEGACGQRTLSSALRPRPVRPCAVSSSGIVPPTRRRRWPENGGGNGLESNLTGGLGEACRPGAARAARAWGLAAPQGGSH